MCEPLLAVNGWNELRTFPVSLASFSLSIPPPPSPLSRLPILPALCLNLRSGSKFDPNPQRGCSLVSRPRLGGSSRRKQSPVFWKKLRDIRRYQVLLCSPGAGGLHPFRFLPRDAVQHFQRTVISITMRHLPDCCCFCDNRVAERFKRNGSMFNVGPTGERAQTPNEWQHKFLHRRVLEVTPKSCGTQHCRLERQKTYN